MERLHRLGYWLRTTLRRDRAERELDEELRFHLAQEEAARVRAGLAPDEARHAAARDFGGVERWKDECRDARGASRLEAFARDLRHAGRAAARAPGLMVLVVLVLALGVGANTAIFSVVRGVLLRPLPYRDADRLAIVFETDRNSGTTSEPASLPDFTDFRARNHVFAAVEGAFTQPASLVSSGTEPEQVETGLVTAGYLRALGVHPSLGRDLADGEDGPGAPRVALVSDRLWRRRFGADPRVVGRTLRLDDATYTIVGVVPPRVELPSRETDVWLPFPYAPGAVNRSRHFVSVLARLAPGVTLDEASREMTAIAAALEREYPDANHARGVRVEPLPDVVLGRARPALAVLFGAVALVLLIACANAANLLLARTLARRRETAVRVALGASLGRLAGLYLAESAIVALAAGALGVALAAAGVRLLRALAPADLPRLDEVRVDPVVLGYALGLAALVSLAFGLLPLLESRRLDVHGALKTEGGRLASASRGQRRLRGTLVIGEVALSVVLLVGASLLLRSFWALSHVSPGFAADGVLKASFDLPESRYPRDFSAYPRWPASQRFIAAVQERLTSAPGVRGVALASNHPLDPGFTNSFLIVGREAEASHQPEIRTRAVTPSYFPVMGVPLVRGRLLEERDDARAAPVAVINAAAARAFFAGMEPVGRRIRFWGIEREIVGVVGDERFMGLRDEAPPALYAPFAQMPSWAGAILVRTGGDPARLEPLVRQAVRAVDADLALHDVTTMGDAVSASVAQPRFVALLLGAFAAVALVLALAGVHGVLSWVVAQRTRELGVRLALGATPAAAVREVMGYGVRLAAAGLALGVLAALGAGRLLRSLLFGIGSEDLATYAAVALGVLAVALLASWLPARRVVGIDPVIALRAD